MESQGVSKRFRRRSRKLLGVRESPGARARKLNRELADLRTILAAVQSQRSRLALLARLAGTRLGRNGGRLRRGSDGVIRLPFPSFEAEFELSQGEISPYAQMVRDVDEGVIPRQLDASDWTIVDCGANVGLFSLWLGAAKRVIAVEPNPNTFRRLKRNMEINGINATTIQAAVSSADGTVKMDFAGPSVLAEIGETGVEVPSRSLDSLLDELGADSVDVLKLDVEGHEIEALEGAAGSLSGGRVKRIFAEHQDPQALADLDGHLANYGFLRVATGQFNARYELR